MPGENQSIHRDLDDVACDFARYAAEFAVHPETTQSETDAVIALLMKIQDRGVIKMPAKRRSGRSQFPRYLNV
ncbi:MAG: hypothetical protein ABI977_36150 [Acidobacteriota bacterium]